MQVAVLCVYVIKLMTLKNSNRLCKKYDNKKSIEKNRLLIFCKITIKEMQTLKYSD